MTCICILSAGSYKLIGISLCNPGRVWSHRRRVLQKWFFKDIYRGFYSCSKKIILTQQSQTISLRLLYCKVEMRCHRHCKKQPKSHIQCQYQTLPTCIIVHCNLSVPVIYTYIQNTVHCTQNTIPCTAYCLYWGKETLRPQLKNKLYTLYSI